MTTTAKTILILAICLGVGAGAYFLLKPKESSAGGHAGAGGSARAGDNDGVKATINEVPTLSEPKPTSSEPTSSDSGPRISRITFKVEPAPPTLTPFHIEPYGDNDVPFTSDLNPYGAVWGDIPWELLTEKDRQDIIDYYKEHPDIVNPYYDYCHVGKPPKRQQPYTYQNLEYHRLGYTLRLEGGSSDMIILPFDKTTKQLPHQGGIIYVANGAYGIKWGLDMTAVDDGIEWKLEIQDNVVKTGKFLFKDIEFGKVGASFGSAIIKGVSSTQKIWWLLSLWVDV